uniref:Uncharacterized protein n=1 Tax=Arundo donax TaxID=35708 RepID=A0A0A9A6P1_ARUDO
MKPRMQPAMRHIRNFRGEAAGGRTPTTMPSGWSGG